MAEFVASAVANVVLGLGGSAGTALTIAGFVADYGLIVGGLALSYSQQQSAKRKAKAQFNAAQVDRLAAVSSPVAPRELVLGRVRKSGNVFFRGTTGTNKTIFVMAMALAAHEIDAVETIYLNNVPVTLDGSGNVTTAPYQISQVANMTERATGSLQTLTYPPIAGTVVSSAGTPGPEGDLHDAGWGDPSSQTGTAEAGAYIQYQYIQYISKANIRVVRGTAGQPADAEMISLFGSQWTTSHRADGVAYLVCKFTYDETAFPNGLPQVSALIRGAKVYDPRENTCLYSEDFSNAAWTAINAKNVVANTTVAPDGTTTADTISDASALVHEGIQQVRVVENDSGSHCFSIYVRKTSGGTAPTFGFNLVLNGGTTPINLTVRVNTDTGQRLGSCPGGIEDAGSYWRVWGYVANNASGNTFRYVQLWPAVSAYGGGVSDVVTATGSAVVWGACWNSGATPAAYCPTTSAAITPVTAWSDNPALLMRHVYTNAWFGKAASVTASEDVRFAAAANACDATASYVVNGVTTPSKLFRASTVAAYGTAAASLFDDLSQAMAGSWAFAGGELFIKPGVFSASVMSLGESDLAMVTRSGASEQQRSLNVVAHKPRSQKFNTVNIQLWDSSQDYKQISLTPLVGTGLVARDGASLAQAVTMSAVTYAPQALHIAGVMMRDARDPLTITLPFKLKAYPIELFDTIDLTISRYGWTNKLFLVIGREWGADGSLQLTLKETASSIFALDAAFAVGGYASNTNLPNPWSVPTIGTLTATSGTSELFKRADGTVVGRIRVSWPAVDDAQVNGSNGSIEVQYRSVLSDGAWTSVTVGGSETQAYLVDVQEGNQYTIRARARNGMAVGTWNTHVVHQMVGKTELPSTVTGAYVSQGLLFFTRVSDLDVVGYEVRSMPGASGVWSRATPMHNGWITDMPWSFPVRLYGLQTILVAAVDSSGNVGLPATALFDFGIADTGNVVQSYDWRAATWPGTLTNCSVSGGDLVASVDGASDKYALTDLYSESDVYATSYLPMQWVSTPLAPWYQGGTLSLDHAEVGPAATIEYTIDGDTLVDLYGLSDVYAASSLYGTNADFQPWPGAMTVARMQGIIFRVSIDGGATQGVLSKATANLSLADVSQSFGNVTFPIGGVRLSPSLGVPARNWVQIKSVSITPVIDGGGALAGRIYDYPPATGPLAELVNSSGTAVAGSALVTVGGLADG